MVGNIDLESLTAQAHLHKQNKELNEARILYSRILLTEPGHQDSMINLVEILSPVQPELAYKMLLKLEKNERVSGDIRFKMGMFFHLLGYPYKAIAIFKKIVSKDAKNAKAHEQLGLIYKETGKTDCSFLCFKKAFELDPAGDQILERYIDAIFEQEKFDEISDILLHFFRLHPLFSEINVGLFDLWNKTHHSEEARNLFRKLLVLHSDNLKTLLMLESYFSE